MAGLTLLQVLVVTGALCGGHDLVRGVLWSPAPRGRKSPNRHKGHETDGQKGQTDRGDRAASQHVGHLNPGALQTVTEVFW